MGTTVLRMDTPQQTQQASAAAVTKALKEAKVSQRAASEMTGIPLTTLVRRLTGRAPFLITELAALADVCGCTPMDFLREESDNAKAAS